jgi:hypothetical protein
MRPGGDDHRRFAGAQAIGQKVGDDVVEKFFSVVELDDVATERVVAACSAG